MGVPSFRAFCERVGFHIILRTTPDLSTYRIHAPDMIPIVSSAPEARHELAQTGRSGYG
jgi:hypothetical protein